ncbi:MAG: Uma2 family endonuclease [Microcystis panniformis]
MDTKNKLVEIYRADQPVEVLKKPATLSGEDMLPGFVLNLQFLWYDLETLG